MECLEKKDYEFHRRLWFWMFVKSFKLTRLQFTDSQWISRTPLGPGRSPVPKTVHRRPGPGCRSVATDSAPGRFVEQLVPQRHVHQRADLVAPGEVDD